MKKILVILCASTVLCRDPFFYPDGAHRYTCSAIGCINEKPCFATIVLDGREYTARVGQKVLGHEVLKIHSTAITIKDAEGIVHTIFIDTDK